METTTATDLTAQTIRDFTRCLTTAATQAEGEFARENARTAYRMAEAIDADTAEVNDAWSDFLAAEYLALTGRREGEAW